VARKTDPVLRSLFGLRILRHDLDFALRKPQREIEAAKFRQGCS